MDNKMPEEFVELKAALAKMDGLEKLHHWNADMFEDFYALVKGFYDTAHGLKAFNLIKSVSSSRRGKTVTLYHVGRFIWLPGGPGWCPVKQ